jgi:hypothetical protein
MEARDGLLRGLTKSAVQFYELLLRNADGSLLATLENVRRFLQTHCLFIGFESGLSRRLIVRSRVW